MSLCMFFIYVFFTNTVKITVTDFSKQINRKSQSPIIARKQKKEKNTR